jgi:hypothetical protein
MESCAPATRERQRKRQIIGHVTQQAAAGVGLGEGRAMQVEAHSVDHCDSEPTAQLGAGTTVVVSSARRVAEPTAFERPLQSSRRDATIVAKAGCA